MSEQPETLSVTTGQAFVIMRRMEALAFAINSGERVAMEFSFDQVWRALTKAFDLRAHSAVPENDTRLDPA